MNMPSSPSLFLFAYAGTLLAAMRAKSVTERACGVTAERPTDYGTKTGRKPML